MDALQRTSFKLRFFFNSFLVAVSVLNQTIRSRGKKGMISPKELRITISLSVPKEMCNDQYG